MIQRLHLEEAQPSSFAIKAARESSVAEDGTDSESLALEFQALLAQISGQAASIPDQATAIGLALAQTIVTQRVYEKEHAKIADRSGEADTRQFGPDTRKSETKCDNTGKNVVQDKARRDDNVHEAKTDSKDDKNNQDNQTIQDNTLELTTDDQTVQSDQQSVRELISNLPTDTKTVAQSDVQVDEGPIQSAVVEQEAVNQNMAVDTAVKVVVNQVQVETQSNVADLHEKHKHKKDKESSDELDISQQARNASDSDRRDFDANLRFRNNVQNGNNSRDLAKDTQGAPEQGLSSDGSNSRVQTQEGDSDPNKRKEFQDSAQGLLNQKIAEGPQKGVKEAKSTEHGDKNNAFGSVAPKLPERVAESSIQMSILRQAFDNLRASRADAVDTRAKTQTPAVSAPAATSATKSAQGDTATRATKGLARPHVAKMLERVEATLKEAARSRDGRTLSLHLEPVNLGKVKVDVSLREGSLHARIAPENKEVTQALREHAHELQGSLRKLGLDVESVTVSVTSEGFEGEMTSGNNLLDGRSFQQERNNMPQERAQVAENTVGNELADWTRAGAEAQESTAGTPLDHWVA